MAITVVTDAENYTDIFRRQVLLNTHYWQNYVQKQVDTIEALEKERDRIIKGIFFALDLNEAWPSVRELIVSFSSYMERRGYWDIWYRILERAVDVAQTIGDIAGATTISALFARLLFQQSHFQEAVAYYRQTIRMARQIGDQFNEARACTNLGYYYVEHGQWRRAKVLCCHALNIFEQIDSDHGRAHTENHLGLLYARQHLWDQAQQHLEQACKIWNKMGDNHGLMHGFINLGGLYVRKEQPDKALIYLDQALHFSKLTGDETTLGRIYENIGLANIIAGDIAKAEVNIKQAEMIFQKFSNFAELARVWDSLGAVYFHQNNREEAILYLQRALTGWLNLKNTISGVRTLMDMMEYELIWRNRHHAARRLAQIEQLIGQDRESIQYRHLQPQLIKLRRSLTELQFQQATTD